MAAEQNCLPTARVSLKSMQAKPLTMEGSLAPGPCTDLTPQQLKGCLLATRCCWTNGCDGWLFLSGSFFVYMVFGQTLVFPFMSGGVNFLVCFRFSLTWESEHLSTPGKPGTKG